MVSVGIFPFKENSHDRAGNRTRNLMISSQRLWPIDHEAGRNNTQYIWLQMGCHPVAVVIIHVNKYEIII